eukprot:182249-Chlamydomonas_euryale.AAC.1
MEGGHEAQVVERVWPGLSTRSPVMSTCLRALAALTRPHLPTRPNSTPHTDGHAGGARGVAHGSLGRDDDVRGHRRFIRDRHGGVADSGWRVSARGAVRARLEL